MLSTEMFKIMEEVEQISRDAMTNDELKASKIFLNIYNIENWAIY